MVQAEDELSAINMAIGAAFSGARSLAASSGPGIALMIEALGLAAVTETPLVLVDVQRCGPSTGMPTRMEQADLNLLSTARMGKFPVSSSPQQTSRNASTKRSVRLTSLRNINVR